MVGARRPEGAEQEGVELARDRRGALGHGPVAQESLARLEGSLEGAEGVARRGRSLRGGQVHDAAEAVEVQRAAEALALREARDGEALGLREGVRAAVVRGATPIPSGVPRAALRDRHEREVPVRVHAARREARAAERAETAAPPHALGAVRVQQRHHEDVRPVEERGRLAVAAVAGGEPVGHRPGHERSHELDGVDVRGDEQPRPRGSRCGIGAGSAQAQRADRPALARASDLLDRASLRMLPGQGVDLRLGAPGRRIRARREVPAQERPQRRPGVERGAARGEPLEHGGASGST